VSGKIQHGEEVHCCHSNLLFFAMGGNICVFGEVFTLTVAILPAFGRPMHSVALPAVDAGACKGHTRQSAGCRAVLDVHQVIGKFQINILRNWH